MLQVTSVTIPLDGSESTVCDTGINQIVAIAFPAGMTSSVATLEVSANNSQFYNFADKDGTVVEFGTTGNYQYLPPEVSYALPRFVKIVLDNNEVAERIVQIYTREV